MRTLAVAEMAFDIRLPVGLLFLAIGLLPTGFGLVSDPATYRAHSLGVNIDLVWGAIMGLFGLAMLVLAGLSARRSL